MKIICKFIRHNYKTVAIDNTFTTSDTKLDNFVYRHTFSYQKCSRCGRRRISFDDTNSEYLQNAKTWHQSISRVVSLWINGGEIHDGIYSNTEIQWIDKSFKPDKSILVELEKIRKRPEYEYIMKASAVKISFDDLETAIKLSK